MNESINQLLLQGYNFKIKFGTVQLQHIILMYKEQNVTILCNKTQISNLVRTTRFYVILQQIVLVKIIFI